MYIEFKQGEKHASTNADISDDINAFKDCGYLLQKDDIVIDIDTLPKDTIVKMLDYFDIETQTVWTDRGVHLYFKKPEGFGRSSNGVCALGFPIEMKNSRNTPRGLTVKRNGIARKIDNEGVFQVLPHYFKANKKYDNLFGMSNGDQRNNALYAHKMKLANCEGWESILWFINQYIFDEPMDEKEFSTTARSEHVDPKTATHYAIAGQIIKDKKCVKYMGSIRWLHKGEYIEDPRNERLRQLVYEVCGEVDTRYIDEVVKQIEYRATLIQDDATFVIKFKNGYLMPNGRFIYGSYEGFTPYSIDIDYVEDAKPVPIVDEYLNNLTANDEEYKKMLLEAMGFPLVVDKEKVRALGKFFIFRGDGRNGKGTLLQIMSRIYNPKNCTNLSIKQLSDPRYNITMVGKLANLGDDIEGDAINNEQMKMLKNIVTADGVTSRQLYRQSESVVFTTKLFFTTNSNIKSYEKGYAYKRRVIWMPMFNKVDKPDLNFISKITTKEALTYWIKLIMDGYRRLIENEDWTVSEKLKEYNQEYHDNNNAMEMFIKSLEDLETEIIGKTPNEVRLVYDEWNDDPSQKYSPKLLKEALWQRGIGLGIRKIEGRTKRIFMFQKDTNQDLTPK